MSTLINIYMPRGYLFLTNGTWFPNIELGNGILISGGDEDGEHVLGLDGDIGEPGTHTAVIGRRILEIGHVLVCCTAHQREQQRYK